jgi:D-amino-acid oxidase
MLFCLEYDALTYKKFDHIVKNKMTPHIKSAKIAETFTNANTFKLPWFSQLTPNFKLLTKEELGDKYNFGYSYDSFIINSVCYLNWLKEEFTSKGGKLVQKKLSSLQEGYQLFPNSQTFINCTGLGSKYLDDVKDSEVHPIRGQVVLIRAPHIKRCRLIHTGDDAKYCYMIPKGDGTVVLGGTKIKGDYSLQADPEISKNIIDRCVYYMEEDLKDLKLDIVKEYSASRPGRRSGVRLEANFAGSLI